MHLYLVNIWFMTSLIYYWEVLVDTIAYTLFNESFIHLDIVILTMYYSVQSTYIVLSFVDVKFAAS